jgi:nucleotide-binding universal stress UspA family protein
MYQQILVPIDGSDTSMHGLNAAIKLAKSQGGQIRLIHIVNEYVLETTCCAGTYAGELIESLRENGQKIVREAGRAARDLGLEPETICSNR